MARDVLSEATLNGELKAADLVPAIELERFLAAAARWLKVNEESLLGDFCSAFVGNPPAGMTARDYMLLRFVDDAMEARRAGTERRLIVGLRWPAPTEAGRINAFVRGLKQLNPAEREVTAKQT